MDSFLKFLFAWWDTPIYLWSIKVLVGLLLLLVILCIPVGIILSIFDKEDRQ